MLARMRVSGQHVEKPHLAPAHSMRSWPPIRRRPSSKNGARTKVGNEQLELYPERAPRRPPAPGYSAAIDQILKTLAR
jgi:hypothetical protein